jgi:hypothetical protein
MKPRANFFVHVREAVGRAAGSKVKLASDLQGEAEGQGFFTIRACNLWTMKGPVPASELFQDRRSPETLPITTGSAPRTSRVNQSTRIGAVHHARVGCCHHGDNSRRSAWSHRGLWRSGEKEAFAVGSVLVTVRPDRSLMSGGLAGTPLSD